MSDQPLTTGNSAKLYCLDWIAAQAEARDGALTILDLGCGTGANFIELLKRYPGVRYTGVEPSGAACAEARRILPPAQATIHQSYAYDVMGRLVQEPFDVVVSFSVLEHVYRRPAYLKAARDCLKADGRFLINYDAGHFVNPNGIKERAKNIIGPLLAPLGIERYYQRFVPEAEFRADAANAGLEILEARAFNTGLKGIHKLIPPEHSAEHMRRWLDYELWLDTIGTPYRDDLARIWRSRNFILHRAD